MCCFLSKLFGRNSCNDGSSYDYVRMVKVDAGGRSDCIEYRNSCGCGCRADFEHACKKHCK